MATQQEQFRENVAAAQDQVEKISAQARQATRESAQAAQQTQQALAQNTERLSQQGGQVAATAFDTAWETWMAALPGARRSAEVVAGGGGRLPCRPRPAGREEDRGIAPVPVRPTWSAWR